MLAKRPLRLLVLVPVAITAALFAARDSGGSGMLSNEAQSIVARPDSALPARTAFAESFSRGFAELTLALCQYSSTPLTCAETRERLDREDSSGLRLDVGVDLTHPQLAKWLSQVGAGRRENVEAVQRILQGECYGADAPYSTALAIDAMKLAPQLIPHGLLEELISHPPFDLEYLRHQALGTIAGAANRSHLSFFVESLRTGDEYSQAKALSGLSRLPGGREILANHLIENPHAITSHMRHDLGAALFKARLVEDPRVVDALLRSGESHIQEETLRALSRNETWGAQAARDSTVGAVLRVLSQVTEESGGEPLHGASARIVEQAVAALSSGGQTGMGSLWELVLGDRLEPRHLIEALCRLLESDEYSDRALERLVLAIAVAETPDQVSVILHALVGRVDSARMLAVAVAWIDAHPLERDQLVATLTAEAVAPSVAQIGRLLSGSEN